MPFDASVIFCFTSSTSAKTFPFEDFFYPGKQKKKGHLGQDRVNREGGAKGSCYFWSKTAEHSVWTGAHISPIVKWANVLKESSKKFH